MRMNEYGRLDLEFSYYRTERGAEVDCIIRTPSEKMLAVEIKSTRMPTNKHCSGPLSFKQVCSQAELILACQAPKAMKIQDVLVLPWQEALHYIEARV